jgi:peptidoglycan/LPS O-acetylase OafA/YrhL
MHFRVLDSWRGIAALLVALFHLNLYSVFYSLDFVRNSWLLVDSFFVLSGFVITHSYGNRLGSLQDLGTFAIRRFGRLWPLHVVVLLAFVLAESAKAVLAARGANFYNTPFTGPNSLDSIPVNLAFAQSLGITQFLTWNPPSWSISAEFWTYLIFAFALVTASTLLRRVRFAAVGLVVGLLIGSVAILVAFSKSGMDATYDLGLVRCLYGFLVGHLTYRLWQVASRAGFGAGFLEFAALELAALIGIVGYVSVVGHSAWSFWRRRCSPSSSSCLRSRPGRSRG